MNERLKKIRLAKKLSQEQFGQKISIARSHISSLENGARELTDRTIFDICREFNVSEDWLRTGQGEMFNSVSNDELDRLAERYSLQPLAKKIVEKFVTLEEGEMNAILNLVKEVASELPDEISMTKEDYIEKELEDYRLELEAEQKGQTLSALPDTEEKDA